MPAEPVRAPSGPGDTGRHRSGGRRRRIALAAASLTVGVVVAAVVAGTTWRDGQHTARPGAAPPPAASSSAPAGATTSRPAPSSSPTLQAPVDPTTPPSAAGVPAHVSVPRVGIDSGLQPLGLLRDGTLESPTQWQTAGWYADGVRPGDVGPAVIAGHVDSVSGPAVFFRLRDVRPGDAIAITDTGGRVVRFTVTDVHSYPKTHFPTDAVYGPTALPELRLITCTGEFDDQARSYLNNLVVTAVRAASRAY